MSFITASGLTYPQDSVGISDITVNGTGTFKFLGCSLLNITSNLAWNGTAGSCSITVVQDTQNGDSFQSPNLPQIAAIAFPSGGIGAPLLYTSVSGVNGSTPYYFAGMIQSYQYSEIDLSGRTLNINMTDGRELLSSLQVICGTFALSQNLDGVSTRYNNVSQVLDAFGWASQGLDSNFLPEFGLQFIQIKNFLESITATVFDIDIQMFFTGPAFLSVPDWVRVPDNLIDVLSLSQSIASQGGCDLLIVGNKVADNFIIFEIRSVLRNNLDPLTASDIANFIDSRADIIENAKVGKEFRNEPESSIIIGGPLNSNYLAYPSSYDQDLHLTSYISSSGTTVLAENYNAFCKNLTVRLFGGSGSILQETANGSGVATVSQNFDIDSGAIFPFWGFSPDDHAYPLIESFLPLDHLVFDKTTNAYAQLTYRIPICKLGVKNFTVRNVTHPDVFLEGDGDPDDRPFAYIQDIIVANADIGDFTSNSVPDGYMRGLPLNTEVMRAAINSADCFFNIYSLHYPDIAAALGFSVANLSNMSSWVLSAIHSGSGNIQLENYGPPFPTLNAFVSYEVIYRDLPNTEGKITTTQMSAAMSENNRGLILKKFHNTIHELVKQYALENMGKNFLVCLPKSNIMQRIFNNQPVPTRIYEPQIEYIVDNAGYFTYVPPELDGLVNPSGSSPFTVDEENQILRKFQTEPDGRFRAMAVMDWKPSGNCSFNSNGINRAMFQDLPPDAFRPNRIASANPSHVMIECSVRQLRKRPDLALVQLPNAVIFDPADPTDLLHSYYYDSKWDEFLASKASIMKYLWYFYMQSQEFRSNIQACAIVNNIPMDQYASKVISIWADKMKKTMYSPDQYIMNGEMVMDLKGVSIPLTSTWKSYGPWYYDYHDAKGMRKIEIDEELVPWNFDRPPVASGWDANLNAAGNERLARTLSATDYLDNASIVVAGFPEFGLGSPLGFNSNLTGINIDFGVGGIKTTYSLATYLAKPGTYRKSDYDNVSKSRIDTREQLPTTINQNLYYDAIDDPGLVGPNRFRF